MAGNLVIVESPAKAGTIQKYLGNDYIVKSSFGHIRDLQENSLSIDIANGFAPEYVIPADKKKVVSELRRLAKEAKTVWLASDEDREGEAISWHLYDVLGLRPENTHRIVFHEITKTAILNAIEHPRDIDMNLVNAQQARRVLDRLVGFELSPVLWKKIQPKLSAGRVQSVALRLVVDREKEIIGFQREQYYKVEATFHPEGTPAGVAVKATLGRKFSSIGEAQAFLEDSIGASFVLSNVEKKEAARFPAAPFTTSTLQQEASRKLHLSVSQTMSIAQKLYESGLITYMRTDSVNLSSLALGTAKTFICENFGPEYSKPRQYKTKSAGAQEAHEAIRPTYIDRTSIDGTPSEKKLYDLIWKRTVASQMADAKVLNTAMTISSDRRPETFSVQAMEVLFDGFLKLYMEGSDDEPEEGEAMLPELQFGCQMDLKEMGAGCKFTAPAPRYSEATLVKKLEELGIGRPSTYAPTITTLTKGRGYIAKGDRDGKKVTVSNLTLKGGKISVSQKTELVGAEKGKLIPQEIGMIVADYLVENFASILDYGFTASVEEEFDKIAESLKSWNSMISEFYGPFHDNVQEILHEGGYTRKERFLGNDPESGKPVVAKYGQYGPYVQKGEGEDRAIASLPAGMLIETITLEEALKLFVLPRVVGQYNGFDIIAAKGRFGAYIKHNGTNCSLPRGTKPETVSLETCIELIEKAAQKPANEIIATFPGDFTVINGAYGPYLKHDGKNFRIPKGTDASKLTAEDCQRLISDSKPTIRKKYKK